jgi:hypothetical protein
MPVAISVIMFASPRRAARPAADRNGQPPQNTTGVVSTSPNQAMDSPNTIGTVNTAETTNRRSVSATMLPPYPACASRTAGLPVRMRDSPRAG